MVNGGRMENIRAAAKIKMPHKQNKKKQHVYINLLKYVTYYKEGCRGGMPSGGHKCVTIHLWHVHYKEGVQLVCLEYEENFGELKFPVFGFSSRHITKPPSVQLAL